MGMHAIGWALAAALLSAAAANAEEATARASYLRYCGACHGPHGHGDGVAGTFMRPKPTDLTVIARENGGRFPFAKVMESIDGTKTVRAHGDSDMPVWGEIFRAQAGWDDARRAAVRGKLLEITQYVQSIQAP
jgi:mono/diheme cytochrome c family protein